jgi:hypothetical protein
LNAFAATGENPINYIVRHMNLDPGVLAAEDQLANLRAVRQGTRVFSAFHLKRVLLWDHGERVRVRPDTPFLTPVEAVDSGHLIG